VQEPTSIYIIHRSPEEAANLARTLESCMHVTVRVAATQLAASDYADLGAEPDTGAVIIEQRLDPHSTLRYCGIDVAEHLRRAWPALPIYLIAPREESLAGREAIVDDVIPEDELLQRCPVYALRMLRAMGRYLQVMSERDRRYRELLASKLDGRLSQTEEVELAQYRTDIELPFAGSATEYAKTWKSSLSEEERLLQTFTAELRDVLDKLP